MMLQHYVLLRKLVELNLIKRRSAALDDNIHFSSSGSVIKVVILWQEIRLNEHEINPTGELVSRCDSCWGICMN